MGEGSDNQESEQGLGVLGMGVLGLIPNVEITLSMSCISMMCFVPTVGFISKYTRCVHMPPLRGKNEEL